MHRVTCLLLVGLILAVVSSAQAQVQVAYYAPAGAWVESAPITTYYAPAPVTAYYPPTPAPVTQVYYSPPPTTVYYTPSPTLVNYYRPLVGNITRVRYAPVTVAYPTPTTVYYRY